MDRKLISESQKQQIVLRYEAGESAPTIAASIGCNKSSVLRCLKREGIERRTKSTCRGGLDPAKDHLVCARYLEGVSAKGTGKEFGISATTVLKILERHGIPRRAPEQTSLKLSERQIEQIVSLYADGMSLTDIVKEVGCGQWSAWHQIKLAGLEIRGARGGDTLKQAIEGTGRFAEDRECSLYVCELARFSSTHCKPGISWDVSVRSGVSRGEYGEHVLCLFFASRIEPYFLEQAVLNVTRGLGQCPEELEGWHGATEVRAMPAADLVPIVCRFADEMEELGVWDFAARYVPMTTAQRAICQQRAAASAPVRMEVA